MNERIRELWVQAGYHADAYDMFTNMEKFAKLIVLEAVKEAEDDCAGWTERDQCLVGQVMDRIKKHFGVEE